MSHARSTEGIDLTNASPAELLEALRREGPHDADAVCNLMGAAARALEAEIKNKNEYERDWHEACERIGALEKEMAQLKRYARQVLHYSSAYIGRAIADGYLGECSVPAEMGLKMIEEFKASL